MDLEEDREDSFITPADTYYCPNEEERIHVGNREEGRSDGRLA